MPSPELRERPEVDQLWRDGLNQIACVAVLGSDDRVAEHVAARRHRRRRRGIGASVAFVALLLVSILATLPSSAPDELDVGDDAARRTPSRAVDDDASVDSDVPPGAPITYVRTDDGAALPNIGATPRERGPSGSVSPGSSSPVASPTPNAPGSVPAPTTVPVTTPPPAPDLTSISAVLDDNGLTISATVEAGARVRVQFDDRRTDQSGDTPLLSLRPSTNKVSAGQQGTFDLRVLREYTAEVTVGHNNVPNSVRAINVVEPRLAPAREAADVVTIVFHGDGHVSLPNRELRYGNPELPSGNPSSAVRPWTSVAAQPSVTLRILNPDGITATLRPRNSRDHVIELVPGVTEVSGIMPLDPADEHSFVLRCGRPSQAPCDEFVVWTLLGG